MKEKRKRTKKEDENEEDRRKRLKFSCKECGERYASNRDLQGHTDRTHDDKWVQCSICPENPLIASISVKSAWLEEKQDLSFPKEPTRPPRSHRPVNLEGHKRRCHSRWKLPKVISAEQVLFNRLFHSHHHININVIVVKQAKGSSWVLVVKPAYFP